MVVGVCLLLVVGRLFLFGTVSSLLFIGSGSWFVLVMCCLLRVACFLLVLFGACVYLFVFASLWLDGIYVLVVR